jgi:hypothetical protein
VLGCEALREAQSKTNCSKNSNVSGIWNSICREKLFKNKHCPADNDEAIRDGSFE